MRPCYHRFVVAAALLFVASGTPSVLAADLHVYADGLASGWEDWSWGGITRNFSQTSPVHGGSASIAVTFTGAWSGLQLGRLSLLDVADYDTLRFYVHGGTAGGQHVEVQVGNRGSGAFVVRTLSPAAGMWTRVDVPLLDLGSGAAIDYIHWFNATDGAQPIFYLDDIAFVASGLPTPTPVPPGIGPALQVDVNAGRHPISPYIYGMNFADESLAGELRLPVRRWGGNATTRYNWQTDTSNHASDWFFENIPNDNANPAALPDGSETDRFVDQDRRTGTATILTVPLIGWTPTARAYACGFAVSQYGAQQSTDPWRPDCGNGVRPNGTEITGNDPADTSTAITPVFVQSWTQHLIGRYGTAAQGGVAFYCLDNEPMLWNSTHRDVHPEPTSYDEMRDRTTAYASAIKAVDPAAQTLGPVEWGWTGYFWSALDAKPGGAWWNNPQDRLAHGNVPFVEWYLDQMRTYETVHGVRILDYLDLHYYPQASGVSLSPAGSAATQALRLRSTRSLWDPSYVDESWINEAVMLVPRLRQWVNAHYPGTRIAVTEYNWGALDHLNGALAQADVLGIFGRESLDLATLWAPPASAQPGAFAFRLYRNYDGRGSGFGEIGVQAASGDQEQLAVYAAERADGALTIIVINKSGRPLASAVNLSGVNPVGAAQVYRYSGANLGAIVRDVDQTLAAGGFTATFPASSVTLFVIANGTAGSTATPRATATPTNPPVATRTPTRVATQTATLQPPATRTATRALTPTATTRPPASSTPTRAATPTATSLRTATRTFPPPSATVTPTRRPTRTRTATVTIRPTQTPTARPTATRTRRPTRTRTRTPTATNRPTKTPTPRVA